jgi:hypothetical protein
VGSTGETADHERAAETDRIAVGVLLGIVLLGRRINIPTALPDVSEGIWLAARLTGIEFGK